jgi:tetratricopeptide (TPR) repeat protein
MKKPVKVPSKPAKPAASSVKAASAPSLSNNKGSASNKPQSAKSQPTKAQPAGPSPAQEQAGAFERAVRLFQDREFKAAKALFARAAQGPAIEIVHAAQMHIRMCDRRLAGGAVAPKTAEERYNFGIALMNQGRHREAEEHLREALSENDSAGHFHYALALCCVLQGDATRSASYLRRAIQLEPGNRIAALNDPDFQRAAAHPDLRDLLAAERGNPG